MQRRRDSTVRKWLVVGSLALLSGALLLFKGKQLIRSQSIGPVDPNSRDRGVGYQFVYGENCVELLNSGGWIGEPLLSCEERTKVVATCGKTHENSWQWASDAVRCGASRLSARGLEDQLRNKWVAVVGDSIARKIYAALLRAVDPSRDLEVIVGHKDFEYVLLGNVRVSFYWAPYAQNVSALLQEWAKAQEKPASLVVSIGLWHMLHVASAESFASDLRKLKAAMNMLTRAESGEVIPISLATLTEVYPPKLRTDKQPMMTLESVDAYNKALADSGLLVPHGHVHVLDVHHLTQGCGGGCTDDGIHYSNATYDAAVQIWANSLRVLSLPQG